LWVRQISYYGYGFYAINKVKRDKKKAILTFFRYCPLCHMGNAIRCDVHSAGGKDKAVCSRCGASWHIHFGFTGDLKWAKLEKASNDRKGEEYLGQEHEPEFWGRIVFEGRAIWQERRGIIREKETIREIVKIRCQFCGNLYNETIDRCPHCGGHRR
jgi:hypothetical protein